ncbi:MAG: hypothetical protein K9N06_12140 [Candidatus Cloacimonetes bacterium]|nr:hypothetical protein [Candidatus Cloacimonadota bacterium]
MKYSLVFDCSIIVDCKTSFIIILLLGSLFVQAQDLLDNPQKIVIDYDHSRLLVSNYGDSSLVAIDSEGAQSYFAADAGFVDGMDIVGNIIYGVGNPRRIIAYNLDTAEQVMDFYLPGSPADYLSSVASDSLGHLFISCPALHTIYKFRLSDQSYWIFAQDNGLNRPNGIFLERDNDRIVVIDDSPGTSIIHAISLSDSTVTDLLTTDLNSPDGIVRASTGEYYIGGYYLPGIYRVDAEFLQPPELYYPGSHMVYPTYDPADHSLLVTYYLADTWERIFLPGGFLFVSATTLPAADPEDIIINVAHRTFHPDNGGFFTVRLPLGSYDVTASLTDYETITLFDEEITEDQYTTVFFYLSFIQVPQNLQVVLNENIASLSWEHVLPADREFQNFLIYKNIDGGEFENIASTAALSYLDTLEPGAEYCYYVTALYEQENESEPSNTACINWNSAVSEDIAVNRNSLFQNYPNPFNPVTWLSFELADGAEVNLDIYNLKGRKIRTLIDAFFPTGKHQTLWDGKDDHQVSVSSGIYFCNMKVNGIYDRSIKMLLLK